MKTRSLHPLSLLTGAGLAFLCVLAAGMQERDPFPFDPLPREAQRILRHMQLVWLPDGEGGFNETIRISGVNVQIVNGLGATNGNPADPYSVDPGVTRTNGLGNLILGYAESAEELYGPGPGGKDDERTGSHNVVVGIGGDYSSYGALVGGAYNRVTGAYASVTGGANNLASGDFASVGGGGHVLDPFDGNRAAGELASVSGGSDNAAAGVAAWVGGGFQNRASGDESAVCAGQANTASSLHDWIGGGVSNLASGGGAAVCGGVFNFAVAPFAVVTGGEGNAADGSASVVSGGAGRVVSSANPGASTDHDWVAGSLWEED